MARKPPLKAFNLEKSKKFVTYPHIIEHAKINKTM
jgi:hypothetical protein